MLVWSTSAFAPSNFRTTSVCPPCDAIWRAVVPVLLAWSTGEVNRGGDLKCRQLLNHPHVSLVRRCVERKVAVVVALRHIL